MIAHVQVAVNLAGLPAVSVPVKSDVKLPVGMQLIGRADDDVNLLSVAHFLEENEQ